MLQFVELLLQWIQILQLQDRTLKVFSGINNLISDKSEYSEVVSQLSTDLCYDNESNELSRWYPVKSNW